LQKSNIYIILLILLLFSCNKKEENKLLLNNIYITENIEIFDEENSIDYFDKITGDDTLIEKIMYVYSPEGLRVRNSPSLDSERIGLLDNLTRVKIIKEDTNNIFIDSINGKWVRILTENINGWVFDGYLVELPIEIKQKIIGGWILQQKGNARFFQVFNDDGTWTLGILES
jgi:uncharacterized protein YgiM (DUF1202 family)